MKKSKKTIGIVDISQMSLIKGVLEKETDRIEFLGKYYDEIGEIIVKHEGKILKYSSAEIMFVFDNAKKAYACSEEMVSYYDQNLRKSNEELFVSLATGDIYLGEIGHKSLVSYEVLGEPVKTAYAQLKNRDEIDDSIVYCEKTAYELDAGNLITFTLNKFRKNRDNNK